MLPSLAPFLKLNVDWICIHKTPQGCPSTCHLALHMCFVLRGSCCQPFHSDLPSFLRRSTSPFSSILPPSAVALDVSRPDGLSEAWSCKDYVCTYSYSIYWFIYVAEWFVFPKAVVNQTSKSILSLWEQNIDEVLVIPLDCSKHIPRLHASIPPS